MRFHAGSRSTSPRGFEEIAAWTHEAELVFLVGAARSGTTWLQAMLASHPAVYSGPETHFFSTYHPVELEFWRKKDRNLGLSAYQDQDGFYAMIADSFRQVISGLPEPTESKRYFLEKSPHHCLSAEFILRTFPNARFIHLVRDPRAVVASLLRVSKDWGESWAPKEPEEAARQWVERVEASRGCASLVQSAAHFAEIRYEDLRAEPELRLTDLLRFLELPNDPASVKSIVDANSLETVRSSDAPFGGIAKPRGCASRRDGSLDYPAGFVGDAPSAGKDADLTEAAMRQVEAIAGPLMRELGYLAADEPARRFDATVVLVTEGDDPQPALETLSRMAARWQEGWELLLVSNGGSAGGRVAQCLEGDFQLAPLPRPIPFAGLVGEAAARARSERLLFPGDGEILAVERRRVNELKTPLVACPDPLLWLTQVAGAVPAQI